MPTKRCNFTYENIKKYYKCVNPHIFVFQSSLTVFQNSYKVCWFICCVPKSHPQQFRICLAMIWVTFNLKQMEFVCSHAFLGVWCIAAISGCLFQLTFIIQYLRWTPESRKLISTSGYSLVYLLTSICSSFWEVLTNSANNRIQICFFLFVCSNLVRYLVNIIKKLIN